MIASLPAAEPLGDRHGLGHQAHGRAMEPTGSRSFQHVVSGRVPKLSDHSDVRFQRHHRFDRRASGMRHGYRHSGSPTLPPGRCRCAQADEAAGPAGARHARVHHPDAPGGVGQSAGPWVWILDLVGGAVGGASGQHNRHSLRHQPTSPPAPPPRVFGPASQAHDEGQAGREGIPQIQSGTDPLKKKR